MPMEPANRLKLKSFSLSYGVQLFKAMGDVSRIRILNVLLRQGELSITDLELILDFSQTKTARLIGVLKNANLIQGRRVDHWVLYRVSDEARELLTDLLEFMGKEALLQQDADYAFAAATNRELSIHKIERKQFRPLDF